MLWPSSPSFPFPYPRCLVTKNLSVIYSPVSFFHLFVGLSERFKLLCIFEIYNIFEIFLKSTQWISFSISYKAESGRNELLQLFFVQESLYQLFVSEGHLYWVWNSWLRVIFFQNFWDYAIPFSSGQKLLLRNPPIVLQISLLCTLSYFSCWF